MANGVVTLWIGGAASSGRYALCKSPVP